MEGLVKEFVDACRRPSDINQHLPLLHGIASLCQSVTEFGVRDGQSTRALLASRALKVRSYDLYLDPNVSRLFIAAQTFADRDAAYIQGNSLFIDIDQTDLLFIDTDHKYSQLKKELEIHHSKVNKYLAFHDTHTYGTSCQEGKGLLPAIMEFIRDHKEWVVNYHTTENNGFTVLEKIS
jgi:hypothetical protein